MTSKYRWCENGRVALRSVSVDCPPESCISHQVSKITMFCLIKCFSIYGMEECNIKCYDLLILFQKTMIHVLLGGSIGSVEQLICVQLTSRVRVTWTSSPLGLGCPPNVQQLNIRLNICDKISHVTSQQLRQQERFTSM